MTNITIPPEALEAAARAIAQTTEPKDKWRYHIPEARAACLAMLKAWPHNYRITLEYANGPTPMLVLPLTENTNAEP